MAMQEFLASYAVRVDEDGVRRLQAALDRNRDSARQLAAVFEAAYASLRRLKKELSDAAGMTGVLSALRANAAASGNVNAPREASADAARMSGLAAGSSALRVTADLSAAEEALSAFRDRLEAERPRLRADATGITGAVSSALSQIRTMISSVRLTVPVTARATLDSSGLKAGGTVTSGGNSAGSGAGGARTGGSLIRLGTGGRVASPTLALVAEEGKPEYVIPTDDDGRAVALIRSLMAELSESARARLWKEQMEGLKESMKEAPGAALKGAPGTALKEALEAAKEAPVIPKDTSLGRRAVFPGLDTGADERKGLAGLRDLSGGASLPSDENRRTAKQNGLRSGPGLSGSGQAAKGFFPVRRDFAGAGMDLSGGAGRMASSALAGAGMGLSGGVLSISLPGLEAALADLQSAARAAFLPAADGRAGAAPSVQAPVNIHVTAGSAQPEAVAQCIYDVTERSLMRTLKEVFV